MITMQATEVLRLPLRPRCKQEQRDKADTAGMQPARRLVRAELRKGLLPSIPTLALCDKPSPHDAAKSPCTMPSHCLHLEVTDSTCR
jgi:hypothetical protein